MLPSTGKTGLRPSALPHAQQSRAGITMALKASFRCQVARFIMVVATFQLVPFRLVNAVEHAVFTEKLLLRFCPAPRNDSRHREQLQRRQGVRMALEYVGVDGTIIMPGEDFLASVAVEEF